MPRKADVTWIRFAVNLSAGEIQKKYHIPASVVHGYRTGKFIIHPESLERLNNAYQSHQYLALLDAGVSRKEARHYRRRSPAEVQETISRQRAIAEELYVKSEICDQFEDYEYGLNTIIIPWMNSFEDRTINDWDMYIKTKKWSPREDYFEKFPEKRLAKRKVKRRVKRPAKRRRK